MLYRNVDLYREYHRLWRVPLVIAYMYFQGGHLPSGSRVEEIKERSDLHSITKTKRNENENVLRSRDTLVAPSPSAISPVNHIDKLLER